MKKLMTILGIVLAMCSMVHARGKGFIVPPRPKQHTLTGTLAWDPATKDQLWLEKVSGNEKIELRRMPKKIQEYENLIGKKVAVKVMAEEYKIADKKTISVQNVISVTEAKP